jgi:hypothetical protein
MSTPPHARAVAEGAPGTVLAVRAIPRASSGTDAHPIAHITLEPVPLFISPGIDNPLVVPWSAVVCRRHALPPTRAGAANRQRSNAS